MKAPRTKQPKPPTVDKETFEKDLDELLRAMEREKVPDRLVGLARQLQAKLADPRRLN